MGNFRFQNSGGNLFNFRIIAYGRIADINSPHFSKRFFCVSVIGHSLSPAKCTVTMVLGPFQEANSGIECMCQSSQHLTRRPKNPPSRKRNTNRVKYALSLPTAPGGTFIKKKPGTDPFHTSLPSAFWITCFSSSPQNHVRQALRLQSTQKSTDKKNARKILNNFRGLLTKES